MIFKPLQTDCQGGKCGLEASEWEHLYQSILYQYKTLQQLNVTPDRKFYALEAIIKVAYNDKRENRKIKVILIEDQLGNKIFYSVMDRRIKNRQ